MRVQRLELLRARHEALLVRGPARRRFGREREPPSLEPLELLDARLSRAGVHTAADLKLLLQLARQTGALPALARGFGARADQALAALERRLRWAERTPDGRWVTGERALLERAFLQGRRVARTADLLDRPAEATVDAFPTAPMLAEPSPGEGRRWQRPRTVAAAWLLERGLANVGDLEQRRRDIRRAQALLEAGVLEEEATVLRRRAARDRAWEQGLPRAAPGWEEQTAWAERTARKSPAEVYQALRVQFLRALEAGQGELALRLRAALEAFRVELAARPLHAVAPPPSEEERRGDDVLAELLLEAPAERRPLLDIGRAAARVVAWDRSPVEEQAHEAADLRHIAPDRRLELHLTTRPSDAPEFVVEDPRRVVHDLASGAQRVRRLVGGTTPRRARRTRARVYLCDASGSMRGDRARLRDALLVAELDALRRQALDGVPVDPLDLCFFGDRALRFDRVDSAEAARSWLERLLAGGPCQGMTELSAALVGAAEWLVTARRQDPALASALVVVVTDGEDAVDVQAIGQAWEMLRGLPVALRVVCLGEENRWLKGWVAEVRTRGGDASWLHLDDSELAGVPGDFDFRPPTLLPGPECVVGVDLNSLRPHLEALAKVSSGEEPPAAPVDALRFDAFFADPDAAGEGVDDAWAADALEAIVEAAALAPFDGRAAEAVALLEHLVQQRGLTMSLHLTRHAHPGPRTAEALRRIRLLCRPAG